MGGGVPGVGVPGAGSSEQHHVDVTLDPMVFFIGLGWKF